jgi:nucleoside-diphosphate-sugar epimerase
MRVFLAGASGAIGRPLVRRLIAAGHDVTGTTRRRERAEEIASAGATPVLCDALDAGALEAAVRQAQPEAVVNQLTSLPRRYNPRTIDYEPTNRARGEGGHNLLLAARAAGARRYVTQSVAFVYESQGTWVKDEEAETMKRPPRRFAPGLAGTLAHEQEILGADGIEGLVLRYGQFYGPGTYYAADGSIAREFRKRRFPVVGEGTGMASFIHVEDAAAATVAAVERGDPGIYNVVDDDPAPLAQWAPEYAEALGAPPPRHVPVWVARLVAGKMAAIFVTSLRGASNEKAKRELGWSPVYPSWRQGFREALG